MVACGVTLSALMCTNHRFAATCCLLCSASK